MSRNILLLIISVLYTFIASCGEKEVIKDRFIPGVNSRSPGLFFPLENACASNESDFTTVASLFSFNTQTYKWSDSAPMISSQHFNTYKKQNPWISGARYRPHYQRVCEQGNPLDRDSNKRCLKSNSQPNFSFSILSKGTSFQLCGSPLTPSRNSADSAYLNASYFISKAAKKFNQITQKKLPKISLEIFPEYRSLYSAENLGVETPDNLPVAFHSVLNLTYSRRSKAISIYPTAAMANKLFTKNSKMYLWESAFALVHEYGHHIEQTLFKGMNCGKARYWNPAMHAWVGSTSGSGRGDKVCSALSEALADLFSYYLVGDLRAELGHISGIENTRDIAKSKMNIKGNNNKEKVLSADSFSLFSSSASSAGASSLTDPHVYGGIISYYLDGVFNVVDDFYKSRAQSPIFDSYDDRVLHLIRWISLYTEQTKSKDFKNQDFVSFINRGIEKSFAKDASKYADFDQLRCTLYEYSKKKAPNYKHIFADICQ